MNFQRVRSVLLWSTIINFGLLAVWGVAYLLGRDWMYWAMGWSRLSAEQMDVLQVAGMMLYKMGVFLFNVVPYVAMRIVESKEATSASSGRGTSLEEGPLLHS